MQKKIKVYNYVKRKISKNMIISIIYLIISYVLLFLSLLLSVFFSGAAPLFVGALAFSSICCLIMSLISNINENLKIKIIYKESFFTYIFTILQIIVWILIINIK
ncbi:MAG: hypothetical protein Q4F88_03770 [Eubacteriales bacterium]|nr:hypothetical protein [Eubacteriales bacterium]